MLKERSQTQKATDCKLHLHGIWEKANYRDRKQDRGAEAEGKGTFGVMEMFHIFAMVTQPYAFVKP